MKTIRPACFPRQDFTLNDSTSQSHNTHTCPIAHPSWPIEVPQQNNWTTNFKVQVVMRKIRDVNGVEVFCGINIDTAIFDNCICAFEIVEITWHRFEEFFVEFCDCIVTWSKKDALC